MGILERLSTVVRSNISELIDRAEDPEKMIKQLLMDMEEDLISVKKEVALSIATEKRLHQQYSDNQAKADDWQKKAELAVSKGEDDLAREALTRKNTFASAAQGFLTQYETQKKNVETLRVNLQQLEAKINEARIKRDLLIARSRQAEAQKTINQTLSRTSSNNAMAAFERMERKVNEKEALAAAYTDLETDSLDDRFSKLAASGDVDNELNELKNRLGK